MAKLPHAQWEVLRYLGNRTRFDACPASSEISYGLHHRYRDWADGKLKGLLAKGLVEVAGSTFSNARTWRITEAGEAALSYSAPVGSGQNLADANSNNEASQ